MKKTLLILGLILLIGVSIKAQPVQRNIVILEVGTGTWCQYCPGAAKGAHQLLTEGKNVAVIENHNGDIFANNYSNARNSFYGISGYPTAIFDGTTQEVGGAACPNGNMYSTYIGKYNTAIAVPSPVSICISGSNVGNNYTLNVSVTKHSALTGNDLRLHVVVTETHIAQSWQGCMTECNDVTRLMVPDQNGTSMSFNSSTSQVFTLNFTKDPTWVLANCEVVAFLQDNSTKEIFNASKEELDALPGSTFALNDFSANITSGCAPLNVNFTTTQDPGVTYTWSFPGGSPNNSTSAAPTVQYTGSGAFDVVLTGSDGVCSDVKTKTNYINVLAVPVTPQSPTGPSNLCVNPASQVYSIAPVPSTDTYTWELTPPESGTFVNNGTNCNIDWSDTWTGTAQLRVFGNNACGSGSFSLPLNISINPYPGQCPQPIGALSMCANSASNQYVTAGIPGATYYVWELVPANAGTFYQGSTDIEIDWNENFSGTATLRVKANAGVCEGDFSTPIAIVVHPNPLDFALTGGGTYCALTGGGLALGLVGSESNTVYNLLLNNSPTTTSVIGTGAALTFGNQLSAGNYTVQATNQANCISMMTSNSIIYIDPQMPEKPSTPTGPSSVFTITTPTSDYTTSGATYASGYTWNILPSTAGSFSGNDATATINWNSTFSGVATISVQGTNTCGTGIASTELSTSINYGVGLNENKVANFKLEPNPTRDVLCVRSEVADVADIAIVDNSGKTLLALSKVTLRNETNFDISMLRSGLYNVLIYTENYGINSLKLIVQ